MNVSLSKNEQIVLFIVVFLVIAVAGSIIFLGPRFEDIEASQKVRDQKQAELNSLNQTLGLPKFQEVEAQIRQAYDEGKDASEHFYVEAFATFEADRLVRSLLAELNLVTSNLVVNRMGTHTLRVNKFSPVPLRAEIDELALLHNDEEALRLLIGDDPTSAVIAEPEDLSDLDELRLYMLTADRTEGLNFLEKHRENLNFYLAAAARDFLARNDEIIRVQRARFSIPLTEAVAHDLSMLIFELGKREREPGIPFKNTYVSSMSWVEQDENNPVGGGMPTADRVYTVDILFFIIEPLQTPEFHYEEMFAGTWN
jgi:hypothetical protein